MGKIANIIENGLTGLVDAAEMTKRREGSTGFTVLPAGAGKSGLRSFVFGQETNRKYLRIAIIGAIIQFVIFKLLYPYPDFISDSYSYISTNLYDMKVNLWPIGYSKFLAAVHAITYYDTFLILLQYAIVTASFVYFFFSIRYLFTLNKVANNILFVFIFFNPAFLYLSNCVLSDALFLALSLTWFTQILYLLFKPRSYQILTLAITVGLMFTLRYTAIYYPIAAVLAFMLSRLNIRLKLVGIIAPAVFMVPFVIYTQQCTKEVTGTAEFSVFGGWQIANNALYMYDHINVDTTKLPAGSLDFDRMVRAYFRRVPAEFRELQHFPGTFFIKHQDAPLKQYMFKAVKDSSWGFSSWGKVSPMYNAYGSYLIKTNPIAFAQYYLLLNTQNYFVPHLEKFGSYNIGTNEVWPEAKKWFHYTSSTMKAISLNLQGNIFFLYPTIFLVLNAYFLILFARYLITMQFRQFSSILNYVILTGAGFLLLNFCFSVFATPVVLRYQLFPMILLLALVLLIIQASDNKVKSL